MTRPSTLYHWATDTNYTGGPESGNPNKTAPTTGLQDQGWEPGEEPGAQEFNALQNNIFDWLDWLDIGDLDGNWSFGPPANATPNSPIIKTVNSINQRRVVRDHLGFPGGRVSEMREDWWDLSTSSIPDGTDLRQWTFAHTGTGNAFRDLMYANTTPDFAGYYALTQSIGNGAGVSSATANKVFTGDGNGGTPHPNAVVVMEWEVFAADISGASPGATLVQGLSAGSNNRIVLAKDDGNANWLFKSKNNAGTTTTVDTGVAVSSSAIQRMRIELYGASAPGVQARGILFINGTSVATITTNLPHSDVGSSNGLMNIFFEITRTSAAATLRVQISPLRLTFNRVTTDDLL